MQQKLVGKKLYVLDFTPYVIEDDEGAEVIYVQQEKFDEYVELNPTLADKIKTINYLVYTVKKKEWADGDDPTPDPDPDPTPDPDPDPTPDPDPLVCQLNALKNSVAMDAIYNDIYDLYDYPNIDSDNYAFTVSYEEDGITKTIDLDLETDITIECSVEDIQFKLMGEGSNSYWYPDYDAETYIIDGTEQVTITCIKEGYSCSATYSLIDEMINGTIKYGLYDGEQFTELPYVVSTLDPGDTSALTSDIYYLITNGSLGNILIDAVNVEWTSSNNAITFEYDENELNWYITCDANYTPQGSETATLNLKASGMTSAPQTYTICEPGS